MSRSRSALFLLSLSAIVYDAIVAYQHVSPFIPWRNPLLHIYATAEAVKLIATQWHELSEEVRKSYTTRLEDLWAKVNNTCLVAW